WKGTGRDELLDWSGIDRGAQHLLENARALANCIGIVHSFHYREGKLHCEDVDLARVAQEFGTPLYVYNAGTILDHYRRLDAAFAAGRIRPSGGLAPLDHLICYAVKANSNRAILSLF